MPHRILIAQHLAKLFSVLSHPARIRILTELRNGPLCVNSLQEVIGISHSGVSQHLSIMRAQGIIKETREGRHVFYRLTNQQISEWLAEAIPFFVPDDSDSKLLLRAAQTTMEKWSDGKAKIKNNGRDKKAGAI